MGPRYEVELTVRSANNLKNVNWRHGDLRPYAVAWIDPSAKSSTKVDIDHDTDPVWDEKITIPLPPNLSPRDATIHVDIVHANADEGIKPLVGSARLPISEVIDDAGVGGKLDRTLKLKRPSGRPQGKLDLRVSIKEPQRYYDPYGQGYGSKDYRDPYGAPPGGYPYGGPPPTGYPYGGPAPPSGYPYGGPPAVAPPTGYPYGGPPVGGPPAGYQYGGPPAGGPPSGYQYGNSQSAYGQSASGSGKSKFGMGTGLAVGAAAGVLGGLALAEGVDYFEDKVAEDAAEKVEDDYYGDDF